MDVLLTNVAYDIAIGVLDVNHQTWVGYSQIQYVLNVLWCMSELINSFFRSQLAAHGHDPATLNPNGAVIFAAYID